MGLTGKSAQPEAGRCQMNFLGGTRIFKKFIEKVTIASYYFVHSLSLSFLLHIHLHLYVSEGLIHLLCSLLKNTSYELILGNFLIKQILEFVIYVSHEFVHSVSISSDDPPLIQNDIYLFMFISIP